MIKNIYLIRHGQSQGNQANIKQGLIDYELSDIGITQAQEIKLGIDIDKVYTSPYKRAYQTAEIVASNNGFNSGSIIKDIRLREREIFNEKENYNLSEENRKKINPYILRYPADYKYGNGESFCDINKRLLSFVNEYILSDIASENIVIVSHIGAINHLIYILLFGEKGDSDGHYDFITRFNHIKNTGITKIINKNGIFLIDSFNKTGH